MNFARWNTTTDTINKFKSTQVTIVQPENPPKHHLPLLVVPVPVVAVAAAKQQTNQEKAARRNVKNREQRTL